MNATKGSKNIANPIYIADNHMTQHYANDFLACGLLICIITKTSSSHNKIGLKSWFYLYMVHFDWYYSFCQLCHIKVISIHTPILVKLDLYHDNWYSK